MKHVIILILGISFMVSGCTEKSISLPTVPTVQEPVIETFKSFESSLPIDTGNHSNTQITITEGTGYMVKGLNGDDSPERKYTWVKVKDEYGQEFLETIITGYIYTYTYKDLGIKITTPSLYTPYFYEQSSGLILKRNGNIIYHSGTSLYAPDYMEVFYKDPKTLFEDEIKNKQLPIGCTIQTGIIEKKYGLLSSMNGFDIIYIASQDGNLASNGEIFDKQFPQNGLTISFVMDPKRPDRYYKFSRGDCAPGPCSIFGKIEFF